MSPEHDRERAGGGRYLVTEESVRLDNRAVELYRAKKTYRQIADELGISLGSAHQRVQRSIDKARALPAIELIQIMINELETERAILNDARGEALRDLATGRMIADPADPDGPAIPDPEYKLKVMDRLIRFSDQIQKNGESLRRLQGLDQPAQQQISGTLKYEIIGLDPTDGEPE